MRKVLYILHIVSITLSVIALTISISSCTASEESKERQIEAKYYNMEPGKEYTIRSTLLDKNTGETIIRHATIVPEQESGTITYTFSDLDSKHAYDIINEQILSTD